VVSIPREEDRDADDAERPAHEVELPAFRIARGDAACRWPWGNDWHEDHANIREAGLETSSPVGLFPAGANLCGALDMAGNVWEWTRSKWGTSDLYRPDFGYPYDPADGRESPEGPDLRVVRGGSWGVDRGLARCACPLLGRAR
jgi:formylglycine-generating enzyme required for sulfatase activity